MSNATERLYEYTNNCMSEKEEDLYGSSFADDFEDWVDPIFGALTQSIVNAFNQVGIYDDHALNYAEHIVSTFGYDLMLKLEEKIHEFKNEVK